MKCWTTKELAYVRKNALLAETNEVINSEQLAKKLGRTASAVMKKVSQMRKDGQLPPLKREMAFESNGRPWTTTEEKRLIAMHKQGASYFEIGEALGRSKASCSNKVSKLQAAGKIKKKRVEQWTNEQVQVLLDHVTFDPNGYVSNYMELSRVTGKQYAQVVHKVNNLRKEGKIGTRPIEGTTSIKAKESMQKFNDARFAQYERKEDVKLERPMQEKRVNVGSLSIESKEERVIHTVVAFAGMETHTYFSSDGTKIAEIQKEPTPVPASVSHTKNN
ncbi:MAG: helix-turn-helix domain containing protein [Enterococcus casseliflavus]|nr:helix-turn-helix domain containing protein [Enterococcus casseliflavus]